MSIVSVFEVSLFDDTVYCIWSLGFKGFDQYVNSRNCENVGLAA